MLSTGSNFASGEKTGNQKKQRESGMSKRTGKLCWLSWKFTFSHTLVLACNASVCGYEWEGLWGQTVKLEDWKRDHERRERDVEEVGEHRSTQETWKRKWGCAKGVDGYKRGVRMEGQERINKNRLCLKMMEWSLILRTLILKIKTNSFKSSYWARLDSSSFMHWKRGWKTKIVILNLCLGLRHFY